MTKFTTVENPKTLGNEHLDDTFPDADIDDMGRRVIRVGDQQYYVRSNHRSGLWQIYSGTSGPLPKVLQGWFTNIRACEDALHAHAATESHKGTIAKEYQKKLADAGFFDEPVKETSVVPPKKSKKKD